MDELIFNVNTLNPAVILITETFLHPDISDSVINIPNYTVYRCDRETRKGGGVAIYVRNEISGQKIYVTRNAGFKTGSTIESLSLLIKVLNVNMLVTCVYRPGSAAREDDLELFNSLNGLSTVIDRKILIFGDFNFPDINWRKLLKEGESSSALFVDTYLHSGFIQLVKKPTRFRNQDEPSLLDLILSSDENLISSVEHLTPIGKSDHDVLVATMQLSIMKTDSVINPIRNYWKGNYLLMNEFFENSVQTISDGSLEENWLTLRNSIRDAVSYYVPLKKLKSARDKPWMTQHIIKQIRKKRRLWHTYRRSLLLSDYKRYRDQCNLLCTLIRTAKSSHEENVIKYGSKAFYGYMSNILKTQVRPGVIQDPLNNSICSEPLTVANIFANQFSGVFIDEPTNQMPALPLGTRVTESLSSISFTPELVKDALNSLKAESSPGPDELHPYVLKQCAETLCIPISNLMNISFNNGCLPQEWKNAVVTPIYKKGNKALPSNYRPISLTSAVVKCMEKIITKELTQFFLANNVIPKNQHGFVPRRSTVSNLLLCTDQWTREFDDGNPVDVVYLDFEKAFDRVPIERLLLKLEHYGVRGQLLAWISDFLKNRNFCVRISGVVSDSFPVRSGVPQGSVLGPLLFNAYICDLAEKFSSTASSFADDTKFFSNPLLQPNSIINDLRCLEKWCADWLLTLNASKCKVLHMGAKNPKLQYTLNGISLETVEQQEDLGVTISSDLKWSHHISKIIKKCNVLVYLIKRVFKDLTPSSLLAIYKTYVRPIIDYASVVWCPYYEKDINALEQVQRRFTKFSPALQNLTYPERLEALQLTSLRDRRNRGDVIEVFKILHNHYTCNLNFLRLSENVRLRGHSLKLAAVRFNKLPRKFFLSCRVREQWNRLPEEVVQSPSLNAFKNSYDSLT